MTLWHWLGIGAAVYAAMMFFILSLLTAGKRADEAAEEHFARDELDYAENNPPLNSPELFSGYNMPPRSA